MALVKNLVVAVVASTLMASAAFAADAAVSSTTATPVAGASTSTDVKAPVAGQKKHSHKHAKKAVSATTDTSATTTK